MKKENYKNLARSDSVMRVLVDTNVILDVILQSSVGE